MRPADCVVIIPVHNRAALTLECLQRLEDGGLHREAVVLVVDDGSGDATAESVEHRFPWAHVMRGDGSWWWGGCIRRGMAWALERDARVCVWLNDDCRPATGDLRRLVDLAARSPCAAWIEARCPSGWSYGGHRRTAWGVRRCSEAEEAAGRSETFSGNCAALPAEVVARVGLPDDRSFPQAFCDLDYGLRLHRAGVALVRLPGAVAISGEPAAFNSERWLASRRPMLEVWRDFRSPRSYLHFASWRRFALRHWGPVRGPAVFAAPYLRWAAIAALRPLLPGRLRLGLAARRR